jgi:hypothetical protein
MSSIGLVVLEIWFSKKQREKNVKNRSHSLVSSLRPSEKFRRKKLPFIKFSSLFIMICIKYDQNMLEHDSNIIYFTPRIFRFREFSHFQEYSKFLQNPRTFHAKQKNHEHYHEHYCEYLFIQNRRTFHCQPFSAEKIMSMIVNIFAESENFSQSNFFCRKNMRI